MTQAQEHADGEEFGGEFGEDTERIFAALPPARGRAFARTWWGTRWLKALEDTALDSGHLRLGRRFARQGAVGAVSVRPGRITAVVRGPDGTPQRADVLLREFTGAEWERLLEVAAREGGHVAALLDRELPPRLVEEAESAGIELLPDIGDLDATCDCGAWDHCPHTAALCYQMARLLDEDPFVLLLLRGRTEERFLGGLGLRDAGSGEGTPRQDEYAETEEHAEDGPPESRHPASVRADAAFARRTPLPPLPPPDALEAEAYAAGSPAPLSLRGGASTGPSGLDPAALEFLVSDAAARARRMLRAALSPSHAASASPVGLTRRQDAVRMASRAPGEQIARRLASGCGLTPAGLRAAAQAWETGGAEGLSVWEEPWTPAPETAARMSRLLASALAERESGAAAGAAAELHREANRWSTPDGSAQLRCGRDGRWWPYRRDALGGWRPAGGPEQDPAAALAVASGEDEPGRDGRS
ncbi:SWF or SNF family helicase [Streptomyces sp. HNM0575]|uniref:SWF or SNF family helicase n=1 Tax=Streptomyces sp. HNM0575 TaxID=2716338 RepID=UPI00145E19D3|nr:SWF or SNF family helicase [Streptomyces sp. HNM0575]